VQPPPSNAELAALVEPAYEFHDKTEVTLNGSSLEITEHPYWNSSLLAEREKTEKVTKAWPASGVVYVANNSCGESYSPYGEEYTEPTECGNLWVHGTYGQSLTLAAENDIVINQSIKDATEIGGKPGGSALVGLIANKTVRIYRPVLKGGSYHNSYSEGCNAPNASTAFEELTLDASVLALNGSFQLDNAVCAYGTPMGNLNVYGALAQKYRGSVSVSSGTTYYAGYHKNYNYDERLRAGEPPHFLNPVRAAWQIQRETIATPPS
jgi:hypothetical protein